MINGYNTICEFFNTRKDEKVLKSFPIMNISIYRGDKLVTKRYLVARLSITDKKLTIDRLSSISLLPVLASIENPHELKHAWKPQKSIDIPYKFLKTIEFDPETKTLIIDTFMDGLILFIKTRHTEQDSKEIEKLTSKYLK
jgi:hypothetical protein